MNPIDRVIAVSQVFMLGAWEALGVIAFGWNPLTILAVWFVGLWSFNILAASAIRTYFKMMTPQIKIKNDTNITEDDIGG